MPPLPVARLSPGDVLSAPLLDRRGRLLMPQGQVLTERNLLVLRTWGVERVEVVCGEGRGGSPAAPSPGLREEAARRVGRRFSSQEPGHPLLLHLRERALARELTRLVENGVGEAEELSDARGPDGGARAPATDPAAGRTAREGRPEGACGRAPGDPREVVAGVRKLGSPPAVYATLATVMGLPNRSSADIAAVIAEDPALAARLLRLVNSSFYGFPRHVESIQMAVTMAGTSQIRDLALASSVISLFGDIPADELDMDQFWKHALACGVGARVLASLRGEYNVESFFLAGLLHDVGRLILLQEFPAAMGEALALARQDGCPLHHAERAVLGYDHAQVGQALVERWNLGPLHEEAIAFHHAPVLATRYPLETSAVHVANLMAGAIGWGHSGSRVVSGLSPEAWGRVRIEEDRIPALLDLVESQWAGAVAGILPREEAA